MDDDFDQDHLEIHRDWIRQKLSELVSITRVNPAASATKSQSGLTSSTLGHTLDEHNLPVTDRPLPYRAASVPTAPLLRRSEFRPEEIRAADPIPLKSDHGSQSDFGIASPTSFEHRDSSHSRAGSVHSLASSVRSDVSVYDSKGRLTSRTVQVTAQYGDEVASQQYPNTDDLGIRESSKSSRWQNHVRKPHHHDSVRPQSHALKRNPTSNYCYPGAYPNPLSKLGLTCIEPETGLPLGWRIRHSKSMDTPYYLNHETDERAWTPPTGTDIDILRAILSQSTGLPLGWVVCHSKFVDRATYKNLSTNSTHQAPPEGTNHAVLESYLANRFHSTYYNTTSWQHHTAGRTSTLLTRMDQKLETDIYEAQDLYNSFCRFFEGQRALQPPLDKAGRIGCRFRDHTTGRTCDATFFELQCGCSTRAQSPFRAILGCPLPSLPRF